MPRFDFRCAAGHAFEEIAPRDTHTLTCPCGQTAQRELSVPFLPGISGRAATPKNQRELKMGEYREAAQEVNYQYERIEQSGQEIARPDYTTIAKQRASAALAGKIAPPADWEAPGD